MTMPSEGLLGAVAELEERSRQEAEMRLGDVLDDMTTPQRRAAIIIETLRVMGNELDFVQTRRKGQLILELYHNDLFRFHPSQPLEFSELMQDVKISMSEASDLLAWEQHIYHYLETEVEIAPAVVWHRYGKTKMRRMTPYLRHIIVDGYESKSRKVRDAIAKLNADLDFQRMDAAMYKWECDYAECKASGTPVTEDWAAMGEKLLMDDPLTEEEANLLRDVFDHEFPFDRKRELVILCMDVADTSTTSDYNANMSPDPTPMLLGTTVRHRVIEDDEEYEIYRVRMDLAYDQYRLLKQRMDDRMRLAYAEGEDIDRREKEDD